MEHSKRPPHRSKTNKSRKSISGGDKHQKKQLEKMKVGLGQQDLEVGRAKALAIF